MLGGGSVEVRCDEGLVAACLEEVELRHRLRTLREGPDAHSRQYRRRGLVEDDGLPSRPMKAEPLKLLGEPYRAARLLESPDLDPIGYLHRQRYHLRLNRSQIGLRRHDKADR